MLIVHAFTSKRDHTESKGCNQASGRACVRSGRTVSSAEGQKMKSSEVVFRPKTSNDLQVGGKIRDSCALTAAHSASAPTTLTPAQEARCCGFWRKTPLVSLDDWTVRFVPPKCSFKPPSVRRHRLFPSPC